MPDNAMNPDVWQVFLAAPLAIAADGGAVASGNGDGSAWQPSQTRILLFHAQRQPMPGATIVNYPDTPALLLLAVAPGVVALTLGAFLLATGWVRPLGATLVAAGLALSSLVVVVSAAFGFAGLSGLAETPLLLLGIPLGVFALALGVLFRRTRSSIPASALCTAAGLAGLYWLGGFVLMQSACGFHSGGC
jgi:hypothetical protein